MPLWYKTVMSLHLTGQQMCVGTFLRDLDSPLSTLYFFNHRGALVFQSRSGLELLVTPFILNAEKSGVESAVTVVLPGPSFSGQCSVETAQREQHPRACVQMPVSKSPLPL